jgi:hypothetical protein
MNHDEEEGHARELEDADNAAEHHDGEEVVKKRRLQVREASRRFRSRKKEENADLSARIFVLEEENARIAVLEEENQTLRDILGTTNAGGGGGAAGGGGGDTTHPHLLEITTLQATLKKSENDLALSLAEGVFLRAKLKKTEEDHDIAFAATTLLMPTSASTTRASSPPVLITPFPSLWPASSSPPCFIAPSPPSLPAWPTRTMLHDDEDGSEADVALTIAAPLATGLGVLSPWGSLSVSVHPAAPIGGGGGGGGGAGGGGSGSARVGYAFAARPANALLADSHSLLSGAARDVGAFIGETGWLTIWRSLTPAARGSVRDCDEPVSSTMIEAAHSRASAARLAQVAWDALVHPKLGTGTPSALSGIVISSRSLIDSPDDTLDAIPNIPAASSSTTTTALVERFESFGGKTSRFIIAACRVGPISRRDALSFLEIDVGGRALMAADGRTPHLDDCVYLGVARTVDAARATAHGFGPKTDGTVDALTYAGYACVQGVCRLFAQVDVKGRGYDRVALGKASTDFSCALLAEAVGSVVGVGGANGGSHLDIFANDGGAGSGGGGYSGSASSLGSDGGVSRSGSGIDEGKLEGGLGVAQKRDYCAFSGTTTNIKDNTSNTLVDINFTKADVKNIESSS